MHFVNPPVVVFGSVAVIFAYLLFDIIELGTIGAQPLLASFGSVSLLTPPSAAGCTSVCLSDL